MSHWQLQARILATTSPFAIPVAGVLVIGNDAGCFQEALLVFNQLCYCVADTAASGC